MAPLQDSTVTGEYWNSHSGVNLSFAGRLSCTWLERPCSDCKARLDLPKAPMRPWRKGRHATNTDCSIDLEFYGQIAYVFFVVPKQTDDFENSVSLMFSVDETSSESVFDIDNALVYVNARSESGSHSLQIFAKRRSDTLSMLDYMIYTTDVTAGTNSGLLSTVPRPRSVTHSSRGAIGLSLPPHRMFKRQDGNTAILVARIVTGIVLGLALVAVVYRHFRGRSRRRATTPQQVEPWFDYPHLMWNRHSPPHPVFSGSDQSNTALERLNPDGVAGNSDALSTDAARSRDEMNVGINSTISVSDSQIDGYQQPQQYPLHDLRQDPCQDSQHQQIREISHNVEPARRRALEDTEMPTAQQVSLGDDITSPSRDTETTRGDNNQIEPPLPVGTNRGHERGDQSTVDTSTNGTDLVQRQIVELHQEVERLRTQLHQYQSSDRIDEPPPSYY